MPGRWASSRRRSQLPPDWPRIRAVVRARAGGRCERITDRGRCPRTGTDCDHALDRDDHRPEACEWLCPDHHKVKTQREARAAAAAIRAKARRPTVRHPGLK